MKFAKGQRVTVLPLSDVEQGPAYGMILNGFPVKRFAEPDVNHYTVKVAYAIYEIREEDLA